MWRYKLVRIEAPCREPAELRACEAQPNELGRQRWEVVEVIAQGEGWLAVLKMPHEVGTY